MFEGHLETDEPPSSPCRTLLPCPSTIAQVQLLATSRWTSSSSFSSYCLIFQVQSAIAAGNMEKEKETLLELKNRTSPSSPGHEETLLGSPGSVLSKVVVNGGESL